MGLPMSNPNNILDHHSTTIMIHDRGSWHWLMTVISQLWLLIQTMPKNHFYLPINNVILSGRCEVEDTGGTLKVRSMSDRWDWGLNHVSDKYEVWRRCTQKTSATRGSARIKAWYKVHGTNTSYEVWAYLWPSWSNFLDKCVTNVTVSNLDPHGDNPICVGHSFNQLKYFYWVRIFFWKHN